MKIVYSVAVLLGVIAVLAFCYKPYIGPAYHTHAFRKAAQARDSVEIEKHKEALVQCGRLEVYVFSNLKPAFESSLGAIGIEYNQKYPNSMLLTAWDGNSVTIWASPNRSSVWEQLIQKYDTSHKDN